MISTKYSEAVADDTELWNICNSANGTTSEWEGRKQIQIDF